MSSGMNPGTSFWRCPSKKEDKKKTVEPAKIYTYIPHFDPGPPKPPPAPVNPPKMKAERAKVYTYVPHFDPGPSRTPPILAAPPKKQTERAKVYAYVPHFDKQPSPSPPTATPVQKTSDYYIYEGPNAGRLASSLTYQQPQFHTFQAYGVPHMTPGGQIHYPQAMIPCGVQFQQPPNVPAGYIAAYYVSIITCPFLRQNCWLYE